MDKKEAKIIYYKGRSNKTGAAERGGQRIR
jgi:hypothetical protein